MANTEIGWTTERPDENGIYWHWQEGMLPEVLLVHGGFIYDFGDKEPTSIGLFDGRGKWLGPIYASDVEQLSELRKACEAALLALDQAMFHKLDATGDRAKRLIRAALNPSHSQEEKETQGR